MAREEAFIGTRSMIRQYFCSQMESLYPQDEVKDMGEYFEVKPVRNLKNDWKIISYF